MPGQPVPPPEAQVKVTCVSAGTATIGFAMLRTFKYTDDEIKTMMAPTTATPTQVEKLALSTARDCGLLF